MSAALKAWIAAMLLICSAVAWASESEPVRQTYLHALSLAAAGNETQALAELQRLANAGLADHYWLDRIQTAALLLQMRKAHATALPPMALPTMNYRLAQRWAMEEPAPAQSSRWPVLALAALLPGGGHAWLGRWHDAGVSFALVGFMLGLTLWAWVRRMGPVTVFFGAITLWLWSGTVFSALSLHERTLAEAYLGWWQQLWLASGLPGQPW